jgi:hypothetical protein
MMPGGMRRRFIRRFAWLGLLPLAVLLITLTYMLGMAELEGDGRRRR